MIDPHKEYWFFIESYSYTFTNENEVLIINTLDGKKYYSNLPLIVSLIKQIYEPGNGGVIKLTPKVFENKEIYSFINELRDNYVADIIPLEYNPNKPFQLVPKLNIQKAVLTNYTDGMIRENITSYLQKIYIVLYGMHTEITDILSLHSNENEISIVLWESILSQTNTSIHIVGNPFIHSKSKQLIDILNNYESEKYIHIHYSHLVQNNFNFKSIIENIKLKIYVDSPINEEKWSKAVEMLEQYHLKNDIVFLIKNHYCPTKILIQKRRQFKSVA